jgi:hypothetical protein
MVEEFLHLIVHKKQRETEREREREKGAKDKIPQGKAPMTYLLPPSKSLLPKVSRMFQNSASSWGPSTQHMSYFGDTSYPNHNNPPRFPAKRLMSI